MASPYLSVVVCAYNEADATQPFIHQLNSALSGIEYELIYVDDGSTDQTLAVLLSLDMPHLQVVELARNYGQSAALSAGIDAARGTFIALLDGDGQNDPSDIPLLIEQLIDQRVDLVAGIRQNRQDGFFLRKVPSRLANRLIRAWSGLPYRDYGCTLKVFRSELAKSLHLYGELHRFIPVLAHLEGARIRQMPVRHHLRLAGQSKYSLNRTLRVLSDLLLMLFLQRYHTKPMHLFGSWGLLSLLSGGLMLGYLLVMKLLGYDIGDRPLLVVGAILVLAGLQLISLGLLAEMQLRTYYETRDRKPYKVRKIHQKPFSHA